MIWLFEDKVINKYIKEAISFFTVLFLINQSYFYAGPGLIGNEVRYLGRALINNFNFSSYLYKTVEDPAMYFTYVIKPFTYLAIPTNNFLILRIVFILFTTICFFKLCTSLKANKLLFLIFLYWFYQKQALFGGNNFFGQIQARHIFYSLFLLFISFALDKKINKLFYTSFLMALIHLGDFIIILPILIFIIFNNFTFNEVLSFFKLKKNLLLFLISFFMILYNVLNYFFEPKDYNSIKHFVDTRFPQHVRPYDNLSTNPFDFVDSFGWSADFKQFYYFLTFILLLVFIKTLRNKILIYTVFSGLTIIFYFYILFYFQYSEFAVLGPYRVAGVFTIFAKLSIILFLDLLFKKLKTKFTNISQQNWLTSMFFLVIIFLAAYKFFLIDEEKYFGKFLSFNAKNELVEELKNLSPEYFIYDADLDSEINYLESISGVPNYVSYKLAPHNLNYYKEWLERYKKVQALDCELFSNFNIVYLTKIKNNFCDLKFYKEIDSFYFYTNY